MKAKGIAFPFWIILPQCDCHSYDAIIIWRRCLSTFCDAVNMNLPAEKEKPAGRRARIAVLEKTFAILALFGPDAPELRIADIAARSGMNRSSVQRLTHTLIRAGWLHRDPASGVLSLTHRVTHPAHVFLASNQVMELVMPLLVRLNAETGANCDLWLRDGDDAITLARVPSVSAAPVLAPVGSRVRLHEATAGRALLAADPPEARSEYLSRHQASEACMAEIVVGHASGIVREAGSNGTVPVIAAAMRDAAGDAVAAISLSGWRHCPEQKATDFLVETVARANELRIATAVRAANMVPTAPAMPPFAEDDGDPLLVAAVGKGLHLLQLFQAGEPLLTLTALSSLSGYPVATVQRITDTLAGIGLLERDERRRAFHISRRALDLIYRFQMSSGLVRSVWPKLVHLREECGLRVSFCVLDGPEIVHLLHVQSRPQSAFRTAYPGRHLPAVSSSGGRIMLAHLPVAEMDAILAASPLKAFTPQTVTDRSEIRREILAARARGLAFTDRQSIPDEVNIAAALVGPDGRPCGAIVVSAPVHSWSVERLEKEVAPLLLAQVRESFAFL